MQKIWPLLTLLLCATASAELRADIARDTPPGQATMKVYDGEKVLFQATTPGLSAVTASKFSPDGRWLLNIADGSGYVQLWDVEKGKRIKTFLAPFARIVNADFTPDSQHVLLNFPGVPYQPSENPYNQASFWNLAPLQRVTNLNIFSGSGQSRYFQGGYDRSVSFSADGTRMVFASSGGYGRSGAASVWNAKTGTHLATISRLPYPKGAAQTGGAGAMDARLSPDGRRVLVRYVDDRLAEYDAGTGNLLKLRGKFSAADAGTALERFAREGR